jgi:hypothetical protein
MLPEQWLRRMQGTDVKDERLQGTSPLVWIHRGRIVGAPLLKGEASASAAAPMGDLEDYLLRKGQIESALKEGSVSVPVRARLSVSFGREAYKRRHWPV